MDLCFVEVSTPQHMYPLKRKGSTGIERYVLLDKPQSLKDGFFVHVRRSAFRLEVSSSFFPRKELTIETLPVL
jgi:hypothetical protein